MRSFILCTALIPALSLAASLRFDGKATSDSRFVSADFRVSYESDPIPKPVGVELSVRPISRHFPDLSGPARKVALTPDGNLWTGHFWLGLWSKGSPQSDALIHFLDVKYENGRVQRFRCLYPEGNYLQTDLNSILDNPGLWLKLPGGACSTMPAPPLANGWE